MVGGLDWGHTAHSRRTAVFGLLVWFAFPEAEVLCCCLVLWLRPLAGLSVVIRRGEEERERLRGRESERGLERLRSRGAETAAKKAKAGLCHSSQSGPREAVIRMVSGASVRWGPWQWWRPGASYSCCSVLPIPAAQTHLKMTVSVGLLALVSSSQQTQLPQIM